MDIRRQEMHSSEVMYYVVMIANVRAANEKLEKAEGWPPLLFSHLNAHCCLFCCSSPKQEAKRSYSAMAKWGYSWSFGQTYLHVFFLLN